MLTNMQHYTILYIHGYELLFTMNIKWFICKVNNCYEDHRKRQGCQIWQEA